MKNKNRIFTIAFLLISVFLIILLAWWFLWREPPLPEGLVQANGRIEGDHMDRNFNALSPFMAKI